MIYFFIINLKNGNNLSNTVLVWYSVPKKKSKKLLAATSTSKKMSEMSDILKPVLL